MTNSSTTINALQAIFQSYLWIVYLLRLNNPEILQNLLKFRMIQGTGMFKDFVSLKVFQKITLFGKFFVPLSVHADY